MADYRGFKRKIQEDARGHTDKNRYDRMEEAALRPKTKPKKAKKKKNIRKSIDDDFWG